MSAPRSAFPCRFEKPPPEFDVRLLVRAGIDKRGRQVRAFETLRKAKKEFGTVSGCCAPTLRTMRPKSSPKRFWPAKSTPAASYWHVPFAPASAGSFRAPQPSAFLHQHDWEELRAVSLINPADALPAGQLHKFNPRKLINRFRRQIERAGLSKPGTFIIGCVDGEWDEGWALFQPHIHLITHKDNIAILKSIVKTWPEQSDRVRVRIFPKAILIIYLVL